MRKKGTMASHRERIEALEIRFDRVEAGLVGVEGRVDSIDRALGRMVRMMTRRGHSPINRASSGSSSTGTKGFNSGSDGEVNPMPLEEQ